MTCDGASIVDDEQETGRSGGEQIAIFRMPVNERTDERTDGVHFETAPAGLVKNAADEPAANASPLHFPRHERVSEVQQIAIKFVLGDGRCVIDGHFEPASRLINLNLPDLGHASSSLI
jgi:hypothetical protein